MLFPRGKIPDKTVSCPYRSSDLCKLGGRSAHACCNAAATDYDSADYYRDSAADDHYYAHSPGPDPGTDSYQSHDDIAD